MEPKNTPLFQGETSTQTTNFWGTQPFVFGGVNFRGATHQIQNDVDSFPFKHLLDDIWGPLNRFLLDAIWEVKNDLQTKIQKRITKSMMWSDLVDVFWTAEKSMIWMVFVFFAVGFELLFWGTKKGWLFA